MKKIIHVGLLYFSLLVSVLFNVQTATAQNNLTVEGEWEVMAANPLTVISQADLGQRLSIVRKGNTFDVKWLTGRRAQFPSASFTGSVMQIANVSQEPIWTGDWTPGEARGNKEPANLAQQVAGITYTNTLSYTLSNDGLTLQRCDDAVRIHWSNGRYTHYEINPCYFKETLTRVSWPEKVENRADRAYQANCGPNDPNRTTPITTNLCPGNLVAMTYFCGGGTGCPYVCCPKGLPYLNHCDCKCYATSEFDCHSYSFSKEQPTQ